MVGLQSGSYRTYMKSHTAPPDPVASSRIIGATLTNSLTKHLGLRCLRRVMSVSAGVFPSLAGARLSPISITKLS